MTWFKVDDAFYRNKKVRKLGQDRLQAVGLWTLAGGWSADNLTDGFVPWEIIEMWESEAHEMAIRLIEVGLWCEAVVEGEKGVQFHDWTDYQPTRESEERRLSEQRERMRALRSNRARDGGDEETENSGGTGDECARDVRRTETARAAHVPDPDPTRTSSSSGTTSAPRKRGCRIPEDFSVTSKMVTWARSRCPDVDGRRETEKFINYWTSTPGAKGLKLNWEKTWMNWMMSADERLPRHLRSVPTSTSDSPWAAPKPAARWA